MVIDAALVPIFQALYNILHAIAGYFWWVDQAILVVGYYLMALTDWLVNTALAPLIAAVANQTVGLLAPIFVVAMLVLAITYLLAIFGYVQIVSMRSAVLWLLFAAFVYQVGPDLYRGTELLRRGIGGIFYEEGIAALSNGASSITPMSLIGTSSEAVMDVPANQFGAWIASDTAVDGLDVAMAYLFADGCDVIRSAGCITLGALPYRWYFPGSDPDYFNNTEGAINFPLMDNDGRQASLQAAAAGIWRLASGGIVTAFGLIEQVIHLVLALAMGTAYVSLLVGVLFAFFKRTEPIAWSVFNLVIELFVQSIITSLLLSLVISFVIIGAATANAVVLFGASFIGLVLAVVLLVGALKALLNAVNRLMGAMSQAATGNFGNLSGVATSALGGGVALASGASPGQAAGVAFANTQAAQTAYYASAAFGQDSAIGHLASQIFEGASAGRIFSPVVAGVIVPRISGQRERAVDEAMPMDEDGMPMPRPQTIATPIPERQTDYSNFTAHNQRIARVGHEAAHTNLSQETVDFLYGYHAALRRQQDASVSTVADVPSNDSLVGRMDASDDDDFARLEHGQDVSVGRNTPTFDVLSDKLRLSQDTSNAIVQQVLDSGQISAELSASLRTHLASLPTKNGSGLNPTQINQAVRALERAATQLAHSAIADEEDDLETQVTLGKPAISKGNAS